MDLLCKSCGTPLEAGDFCCPHCGWTVEQSPESSESQKAAAEVMDCRPDGLPDSIPEVNFPDMPPLQDVEIGCVTGMKKESHSQKEPLSNATADAVPQPQDTRANLPVVLEYDTILPLQAKVRYSLRIRATFSQSADRATDVAVRVFSQSGAYDRTIKAARLRFSGGDAEEFLFQLPEVPVGITVCAVSVSYYAHGCKHSHLGHIELVAVDSAEIEAEAEKTIQFVYNPHYEVSAHEAGRVRLEAPKGEDLDRVISGLRYSQHQRPMQMAQELVRLKVRRYVSIGMSEEVSPPPRKALAGELQISLQINGAEVLTIQLFSDNIIQVGQADGVHRYADIVYGRPAGLQGSSTDAYAKISRKHCQIAWEDDRITLADGGVYSRNSAELRPSTNGTYGSSEFLVENSPLAA